MLWTLVSVYNLIGVIVHREEMIVFKFSDLNDSLPTPVMLSSYWYSFINASCVWLASLLKHEFDGSYLSFKVLCCYWAEGATAVIFCILVLIKLLVHVEFHNSADLEHAYWSYIFWWFFFNTVES